MIYDNILQVVGKTPVVRLQRIGADLPVELFAKCEFLNPGSSVKDRAALYIVRDAERTGQLAQGDNVVEGTAGNTGIGLAIVCAVRGYRCVLVIPETMSRDIRALAMGSTVSIRGPTRRRQDRMDSVNWG